VVQIAAHAEAAPAAERCAIGRPHCHVRAWSPSLTAFAQTDAAPLPVRALPVRALPVRALPVRALPAARPRCPPRRLPVRALLRATGPRGGNGLRGGGVVGSVCGMGEWSWTWDESLYRGSAAHYRVGRMPYPAELADVVRDALGLDGRGRLLDVGCGPGALTLVLAPLFRSVVGVDADREMLAEAERHATELGVRNVEWRQLRAEELPAGLGTFDVIAFAQSFHWMDQPVVARRVRPMLADGGAWVHVGATTHQGVPGDDELSHPRPPWDDIKKLTAAYLGAAPRAGQGILPTGNRSGEEDVMRAAGYRGPQRIEVTRGEVVTRAADEIVSAVFSLSGSAPHLFGDRLDDFDRDLRQLLGDTSPTGTFAERLREIELVIWR
jgi:SAM-dependent methyltransferase